MKLKSSNFVVRKTATRGEVVMRSLMPFRGLGWPGGWASDHIEQVQHYKHWTYIAIRTIINKLAAIMPNMARVYPQPVKGRNTVKACQRGLMNLMGKGFGGTPFVGGGKDGGVYVGTEGWDPAALAPSGGGHSFLTMGEYHGKALSVVKPHEELEPLESDHPLVRLMDNPNPVDTSFDLFSELALFQLLCGIGYLWAVPNGWGTPCELWVIPSHWVWPRTGTGKGVRPDDPHADELIDYYEIRPWGGTGAAGMLKFPASEVISFPWKSPISKIDGWSPLTAGAMWIDSEESITRSRWSQYINQALPSVFVEMGENIQDPDDDMIARLEAKFMQKYQGEFNAGKPYFGPAGSKVTPLSFNPEQMAYWTSEEQSRDMILSIFGVPKSAVGISENMTFGSVLATLAQFCQSSLNPHLACNGQRLTKHLAPKFRDQGEGRGQIRIWWDDVTPADPQQVNQDIDSDRANMAITPNEVRAIRNRRPYRFGGDDPLMTGPGGMVPFPINTGRDLSEFADLVPVVPRATERGEIGQDTSPEDGAGATDGELEEGVSNKPEPPELGVPSVAEPNGSPQKRFRKTLASVASQGYELRIEEGATPYRTSRTDMPQRMGTLYLRRMSDGKEIQAGYWMDFPESGQESGYAARSVRDRAAVEARNQAANYGGLPALWRYHSGEKCKDVDDLGNPTEEVTEKPDPVKIHLPDLRQSTDYTCILPGQKLQGVVKGGSKARYVGDAVEIRTLSGERLSVTVNHPVMTMKGFVPAGQLEKGEHLLRYVGEQRRLPFGFDEQNTPALVEDVFCSLSDIAGPVFPVERIVGPFDFHGDAKRFDGKVQIVGSYRQLTADFVPEAAKRFSKRDFVGGGADEGSLAGCGGFQFGFDGPDAASGGRVGRCDLLPPFFYRHPVPYQPSCFGPASDGDVPFSECLSDDSLADSEFTGDLLYGFAPEISFDEPRQSLDFDSPVAVGIPWDAGLMECSSYSVCTYPQLSSDGRMAHASVVAGNKGMDVWQRESSAFPGQGVGFGSASQLDAPLAKTLFQDVGADSGLACHLIERNPGQVELDEVVEVRRFHYEGPVFDFESPYGFIIVENLCISNCGVSALLSVAEHFGVGPETEAEMGELLRVSAARGTDPLKIVEVGQKLGLETDARFGMSIEDLKKDVDAGRPVIVLIQAWYDDPEAADFARDDDGHYVVAVGYDEDKIYFEDPSLKRTLGSIANDEFLARWHDEGEGGRKFVRYGISFFRPEYVEPIKGRRKRKGKLFAVELDPETGEPKVKAKRKKSVPNVLVNRLRLAPPVNGEA